MLLTSVVVEPPRIAIRVGKRLVCLSSSFFSTIRLRRKSPTAMGNLRAFRIFQCKVDASDDIETFNRLRRLAIKRGYFPPGPAAEGRQPWSRSRSGQERGTHR